MASPSRCAVRFTDRALDYLTAATATVASVLPRPARRRLDRSTRTPIVLVPGVWENSRYLSSLADWLDAQGYQTHVVPDLGWNLASLPHSAARVGAELDRLGLERAVLVAHSKGGLIAKQLMLDPARTDQVLGLVAVATPFGGSWLAALMPPGLGLRSLRPSNAGIRALAANRDVNARIVSIYPREDPHVPEGSHLDGALDNIEIDITGHFRVLNHPRARGAMLRSIRRFTDPDANPDAGTSPEPGTSPDPGGASEQT